jgi:hypothetical protein
LRYLCKSWNSTIRSWNNERLRWTISGATRYLDKFAARVGFKPTLNNERFPTTEQLLQLATLHGLLYLCTSNYMTHHNRWPQTLEDMLYSKFQALLYTTIFIAK